MQDLTNGLTAGEVADRVAGGLVNITSKAGGCMNTPWPVQILGPSQAGSPPAPWTGGAPGSGGSGGSGGGADSAPGSPKQRRDRSDSTGSMGRVSIAVSVASPNSRRRQASFSAKRWFKTLWSSAR